MSVQRAIASDLYGMVDRATMSRNPELIRGLQQHIHNSMQDGAVPAYVATPLIEQLSQSLEKTKQQTTRILWQWRTKKPHTQSAPGTIRGASTHTSAR